MQRKLKLAAILLSLLTVSATVYLLSFDIASLSVDNIVLVFILLLLMAVALWFMSIELIVGEGFNNFISQVRNIKSKSAANTDKQFAEKEFRDISKAVTELISEHEHYSSVLKDPQVLDSARYKFVQVMSHRLRTPITGLSWVLSEVLSAIKHNKTESIEADIVRARESLKYIQALIEELIRLGHVEKGQSTSHPESLQVKELVEVAILEARELAGSKKITLNVQMPEKELPTIFGGKLELISVIQNIISNAIYYSPDGAEVAITAVEKGKGVEISVKDHGIGISEQDKSLLFQPFIRGHNATSHFTEGTGMGLHLSKEIVTQHGGTISFESKEGTGSTFHIYLPTFRQAELERYIAA